MSGYGSQRGWKISQVERLIGLPRRDIQRACYAGKGGVDIVAPADTTWGRRLYSKEDLAWLFLVKLYKDEGYSLPEISKMLSGENLNDLRSELKTQLHRLMERLEEAKLQYFRARSLLSALDEKREAATDGPLAECVQEQALNGFLTYFREARRCKDNERKCDEGPDHASSENADAKVEADSIASLESMLNEPGIDLAIELWAGPGAFDALVEALWDEEDPVSPNIKEE